MVPVPGRGAGSGTFAPVTGDGTPSATRSRLSCGDVLPPATLGGGVAGRPVPGRRGDGDGGPPVRGVLEGAGHRYPPAAVTSTKTANPAMRNAVTSGDRLACLRCEDGGGDQAEGRAYGEDVQAGAIRTSSHSRSSRNGGRRAPPQAQDDMNQRFDFESGAKYARFNFFLGYLNSRRRPKSQHGIRVISLVSTTGRRQTDCYQLRRHVAFLECPGLQPASFSGANGASELISMAIVKTRCPGFPSRPDHGESEVTPRGWRIAPEKRAAVQEIKDMIMLFAARFQFPSG